LFDEIIAHRLGMVPIPTDLDLFTFRDKCSCGGEGCPSCTIMYSLNKKGPCEVYSGDLEPLGGNELRVKDELIPIVKLGPGQALLVYASAQLGTAKQHAKWQVTNGVAYKYYPEITIDYNKCENEDACVDVCPRRCFGKKDGKTVVEDAEACILCMACVEACSNKALTVKGNTEKFLFEFETDGSLSAEKTLITALKILEKKFEDFRELVSSIES
ncbi:MAG: DNA-directed RNA polymerase subunit D, partial [Methanomassiliicoccales archaeon]